MTIQVRYYSRGGNTKKLTECIAKAAGVQAQAKAIGSGFAETEQADILFLSASVYWGGIDNNVKAYIDQLDPREVLRG